MNQTTNTNTAMATENRSDDKSYYIYFEDEAENMYSPFYTFLWNTDLAEQERQVIVNPPYQPQIGERWRLRDDERGRDFIVVNYDDDDELYELLPLVEELNQSGEHYFYYKYDRSGLEDGFQYVGRELNAGQSVILKLGANRRSVRIRFISTVADLSGTAATLSSPAPTTPLRQGTARTAAPAVRRAARRQEPQEGDIWTNSRDEFVYILSTTNGIVNHKMITNMDDLTVSPSIMERTFEGFIREGWQYHSQGPRVGYEAFGRWVLTTGGDHRDYIVEEVSTLSSRLRVSFMGTNGRLIHYFASNFEYRPRGDMARRNLEPALQNERRAQLGVEYTLGEFREKDFPKPEEQLIFRRYRYDYEKKEWVSKKIDFDENNKKVEVEVDCDGAVLGDEWGLEMPVKIKVEKGEGVVWETKVDGELQLYCAKPLREWLQKPVFDGYRTADSAGDFWSQATLNDKSPLTRLKIVNVQYLSVEERDKLQEDYKKNAQENKERADKKKKKRTDEEGNEEEAAKKRAKLKDAELVGKLPQESKIVTIVKKQLEENEKLLWEKEEEDISGLDDDDDRMRDYRNTVAGAKRAIAMRIAQLERLGQKEWVEDWNSEANKKERKQKWIIENAKKQLEKYQENHWKTEKEDAAYYRKQFRLRYNDLRDRETEKIETKMEAKLVYQWKQWLNQWDKNYAERKQKWIVDQGTKIRLKISFLDAKVSDISMLIKELKKMQDEEIKWEFVSRTGTETINYKLYVSQTQRDQVLIKFQLPYITGEKLQRVRFRLLYAFVEKIRRNSATIGLTMDIDWIKGMDGYYEGQTAEVMLRNLFFLDSKYEEEEVASVPKSLKF